MSKITVELLEPASEQLSAILRRNLERIIKEGKHRIIFEELSLAQVKKALKKFEEEKCLK